MYRCGRVIIGVNGQLELCSERLLPAQTDYTGVNGQPRGFHTDAEGYLLRRQDHNQQS
ncbi:hypothetical protein E3U43_002195 [Larimichthys crocea]|uniref:Uncharacterized protein n=1 Tax=Larimichthys crocea TaxID=215358 RepID=A0ACD3QQP7_LARCR|nr:hypothetical protein E3U43_002195 [Larimichthys crocea]